MADQVSGTFDTKRISELNPLVKLNGREEIIIDDGEGTLRVTVDTLLGYIRDQINASVGGGGTTVENYVDGKLYPAGSVVFYKGKYYKNKGATSMSPGLTAAWEEISMGGATVGGGTTIHVIQKGEENIPAESRPEGHFYLRVVDGLDAQLSTGLPRIVRVSPNMGLRMIVD